jgi:hypothetical protein
VAPVFTAPPGLAVGPVNVSMAVTVKETNSDWSTPITLNVVAPTYACIDPQNNTLFNTWTFGPTANGGTAPTFSTNGIPYCLDAIADYHYNDGVGKAAGTIGLTEVCANSCAALGPYPAVGTDANNGQTGPIINWIATPPSRVIINGRYTVVDSDSGTWSYDSGDPLRTAFSKLFVRRAVVTTPP